jgi:DnaJ-class molecular chaperone
MAVLLSELFRQFDEVCSSCGGTGDDGAFHPCSHCRGNGLIHTP